jgi:prepilin-type N-terminal cleavage/methylation domain-containing protein
MASRRGFTLIEMMIVVAVIAILAAVVVPTFFKESAKTRAQSEVTPMMTEIINKLEQYKSETGRYTNATTLLNDTPVVCPSATSQAGTNAVSACVQSGDAWFDLRVAPVQQLLKCSYEINVGDAGDAYAGSSLPTGITFTPPTTTGWWTVAATCDADNSSTLNSTYFVSSVEPATTKKVNDGH